MISSYMPWPHTLSSVELRLFLVCCLLNILIRNLLIVLKLKLRKIIIRPKNLEGIYLRCVLMISHLEETSAQLQSTMFRVFFYLLLNILWYVSYFLKSCKLIFQDNQNPPSKISQKIKERRRLFQENPSLRRQKLQF